MFAKIIGQNEVVQQLTKDWQQHNLAPAMLIFGEEYTGKLTIALELARIIICELQADQHCRCNACQMHHHRLNPQIFLLGNRYFQQEIEAVMTTVKAYLHHNKPLPQNVVLLLIQTMRSLIRRFDSALWEHDDARYKEAKVVVPLINDWVLEFLESKSFLTLEAMLEIEEKLEHATNILKNYAVNVGQVRTLIQHCQNLAGTKRVVIIEQAHLMQDSARNSLLKTLEEPQEGLYFILLTTQKSAIMPTILSRVRPYHTRSYNSDEQTLILERVFRTNQVSTLSSLLSAVDPQVIADYAGRFFEGAMCNQALASLFHSNDLETIYTQLAPFLLQLQRYIKRSCSLSFFAKKQLFTAINKSYQGLQEYNQNPEVLVYSLHSQVILHYKNSEKAK